MKYILNITGALWAGFGLYSCASIFAKHMQLDPIAQQADALAVGFAFILGFLVFIFPGLILLALGSRR